MIEYVLIIFIVCCGMDVRREAVFDSFGQCLAEREKVREQWGLSTPNIFSVCIPKNKAQKL